MSKTVEQYKNSEAYWESLERKTGMSREQIIKLVEEPVESKPLPRALTGTLMG